MKYTFSSPLPGIDRVSNIYPTQPVNLTLRQNRQLNTYPPCKLTKWDNHDFNKLINIFSNQFEFISDDSFDYEEIKFSRPIETDIDIYIGCYVNVARWICNGLTLESIQTKFNASRISLSSIDLCLGDETQPILTIYLKDQQYQLYESVTKNLLNWKLTYISIIESLIKQKDRKKTSPYFILTDYHIWAFIEISNIIQDNINCKVLWKNFNDENPSVRECVCALLLNYNNKLTCIRDIIKIIERNKEICRVQERLNAKTYPRFTLKEIFHHPDDKEQRYPTLLFGASRRIDDHNTTLFLRELWHERGILDFLHDSIKVSKVINSTNNSRLIQLKGDPTKQLLLEKMNYITGNNNNNHNITSSDKNYNYYELKNEIKVYHLLSVLQGNIIPYLHCIVTTDPYGHYDDRRLGLLLEYLPNYIPIIEWFKKMKIKIEMEIFSPILEPTYQKHRYKKSEMYRAPNKDIEHEIVKKKKLYDIITQAKESVIVAIKSIHEQGVVHGDINNHILIKDTIKTTDNISIVIFGFRKSKITKSERHRKIDWDDIRTLFKQI